MHHRFHQGLLLTAVSSEKLCRTDDSVLHLKSEVSRVNRKGAKYWSLWNACSAHINVIHTHSEEAAGTVLYQSDCLDLTDLGSWVSQPQRLQALHHMWCQRHSSAVVQTIWLSFLRAQVHTRCFAYNYNPFQTQAHPLKSSTEALAKAYKLQKLPTFLNWVSSPFISPASTMMVPVLVQETRKPVLWSSPEA